MAAKPVYMELSTSIPDPSKDDPPLKKPPKLSNRREQPSTMGATAVVHLCAILLGVNSLISTNGLWVELPVMVQRLPEGWALPSFLTIIIQLANIGPLLYAAGTLLFPKTVTERPAIYIMMAIGICSSLLMSQFWHRTAYMFGDIHSVALLMLTFFLGLVDSLSSVVCLPFMALLKGKYVNSYMIGEGLSGFLPGVVALVQGIAEPECRNVTKTNFTIDEHGHDLNVTYYVEEAFVDEPNFSPEAFFMCLFAMMISSATGFAVLDHWKYLRTEYLGESESDSCEDYILDKKPAPSGSKKSSINEETPQVETVKKQDSTTNGTFSISNPNMLQSQNHMPRHAIILILVQLWVSFIGYGIFPSIQSYSCLPYGSLPYHLAVNLAALAYPASSIVAMVFPVHRPKILYHLTAMGTLLSVYLLVLAILSPTPPLVNTLPGSIIMVLGWTLFSGTFGYVKVSLASLLHEVGHRALFWCGVVTQVGGTAGAVIMFILINTFNVFQDEETCYSG